MLAETNGIVDYFLEYLSRQAFKYDFSNSDDSNINELIFHDRKNKVVLSCESSDKKIILTINDYLSMPNKIERMLMDVSAELTHEKDGASWTITADSLECELGSQRPLAV